MVHCGALLVLCEAAPRTGVGYAAQLPVFSQLAFLQFAFLPLLSVREGKAALRYAPMITKCAGAFVALGVMD